MKFVYLIIILLLFSCSSEKSIKGSKFKNELNLKSFFQKSVILPDTKIVGYFNPQNFLKNNMLNSNLTEYTKVLKNIYRFKPFFFTLSNYDKRQEILFFFFHRLNFMFDKNDIIKKEKIENYELLDLYETNNQKFSYLELKNKNSIYGDYNLILDLFKIKNKVKKSIDDKKYEKILKNFKNSEKSILKVLFLSNNEDLFRFLFTKIKILKIKGDIFSNIKHILLDIYSEKNNIVFYFNLEFDKDYDNFIFNLLKNNFDLLLTNSKIKKGKIGFKNIKIDKKDKNIIIKLYIDKVTIKNFINREL